MRTRYRYWIVCALSLLLTLFALLVFPQMNPSTMTVRIVVVVAWIAALVWVLQPQARQAGGWAHLPPMRFAVNALGVIVGIALFAGLGVMLASMFHAQFLAAA
ncbi:MULTISPECIES: hypothetical protein [Oleiagrimonas]|jgi:hypothetical protein|uniref:Transmembrane protein n=1 Tax=Oleiagrimonas citrea TaxID=1665687 RepID=A0A846ZPT8_9GAMM|nr:MULTISPECIES: hypothetical protein [Oleiagrimonas]NKZ39451.1 hypothetical protein [Oleiagrimonas citrea]RAP59574.1 hypothetical protein BTJ49_02685 [Oleiagrimonas sp. MCCC 1A03011]